MKQTIIAGVTAIRSVFSTTGERPKGQKKSIRINETPEKVRAVNLRNAIKKLTAILNHNFRDGDYHITLTYEAEPSKKEAKENLRKFKRNMRDRAKRRGITWKWVVATEYLNERIHHHMVCSRIERELIEECWKHGHVNFKELDTQGEYSALAEYLCKETEKTFRDEDAVASQRYDHSRNLDIPEPKNETISKTEYLEEIRMPSEIRGYKIIEDTVNRYENELTREECLQCIMISGDPLARYRRGRRADYEPHYKPIEKQLELDYDLPGWGG